MKIKLVESKPRYYVDTDIFLDHILDRSSESTELLAKIVAGNIDGVTSFFTLTEIIGVLKKLRSQGEINMSPPQMMFIINQIQAYPNLKIIFHDEDVLYDMPQNMLDTCTKTRDALHLQMALMLEAECIVTRDEQFSRSAFTLMRCASPDELL